MDRSQIVFSIVTVIKNNAVGLQKTLHSVFTQTFPRSLYQVIVIDGASDDDFQQVCDMYPPDILISELDTGIYEAMNKGLQHCTGQWVYFLNGGDILASPNVLQELKTECLDHIEQVVETVKTVKSAQGQAADFIQNKRYAQQDDQPDTYSRTEASLAEQYCILCAAVKENYHGHSVVRVPKDFSCMPIHMPASHQGILLHVAVAQANMFNEQYRICGDMEQLARLHQQKHKICYCQKTIAEIEGKGISNKEWRCYLAEKRTVQKTYYPSWHVTLRFFLHYTRVYVTRTLRSLMPDKLYVFLRRIMHKSP